MIVSSSRTESPGSPIGWTRSRPNPIVGISSTGTAEISAVRQPPRGGFSSVSRPDAGASTAAHRYPR
jgi:hypothetical protein